ncbi:MAG: phosphoglucosamine mutase [Candidatus Thorarchaeota archaeon]|nr:phosphoglucosamine mutase [Candidatus Thorarchaeota archaeon]
MTHLFGTNGVRGVINSELTVDMVLDIARAVGTVLGPAPIAVSRDSRMGGDMYLSAVVSGLLSTGCSVVDIGPAPTPTLQYAIPRIRCAGGVMVTASHNPPRFSGVKVIGADGIEVSREVEARIESVYFAKSFRNVSWTEIRGVTRDDSPIRSYIDAIKSKVNSEAIRKRSLKVVVDGANSVGSLVTPLLLRELGCHVVSINAQMDGHFPGREPEPLPENITFLSQAVKSLGADLGIAHDGDADRATFVDERGQVLWGDQSFAIVASRVLRRMKDSVLVTPVSSGRLIEDVARDAGARVEWTRVGSVVVSHRLVEIGAQLGGEENGGVFYPLHQPVRDGAMTAALIVEIMSTEEKSLSRLVAELPVYYNKKSKVPVPPEKEESVLPSLLQMTDGMQRVTLDGVKVIYDEGWVLMRPSGTEPLWRCFAEGRSLESATHLCKLGEDMIRSAAGL